VIIAPAVRDRKRGLRLPAAVILIGTSVFLMMIAQSLLPAEAFPGWFEYWGFRPSTVLAQIDAFLAGNPDPGLARLFGALLVHSSWVHLVGNLAYLWVFGVAVERVLGPLGFLVTFALFGALANLFVALQLPELERPVIGASGGVSAIIGIYLGLFPARRIGLWLPLGLFLQFARIPALLVIGSWFTLQVVYTVFGPTSGAVAWWTHVAGFVAGLLAAMLFRLVLGAPSYSRKD
jgi:membrane associated rhomboid family serine protease